MPVRARSRSDTIDAPRHKRKKLNDAHYHLAPVHPHGVRPSGNSLFSHSIRESSLGLLSALSDEILLSVLSLLEPEQLAKLQSVSQACRAFALYEPQWKEATVAKTGGHLTAWSGSWRETYISHFHKPSFTPSKQTLPPIRAKGLFSDALFLPLQLASTPLNRYVPPRVASKRPAQSLEKVNAKTCSSDEFKHLFLSPGKPCLIVEDDSRKHLPTWTLKDLAKEDLYGSRKVRAEALTMPMSCYAAYAKSCQGENQSWIPDESPFYLFDPTLAKTMQRQGTFVVPALLRGNGETDPGVMRQDWDLFSLLQEQRSDHAWVIAGPSRSGSGWHVDPNSTSAFNTVLSGQKLWMLLPPNVTPPGVYISKDGSSITAPLSIIEWLVNFWDETVRLHGRQGDDTLIIDVCSASETIFVPAGWKHLVINLSESVAFTQNFAGSAELPMVLDMFKNRPEQISGFRLGKIKAAKEESADQEDSDVELDELDQGGIREKRALFDLFIDRLRQFDPQLVEEGLQGMHSLEQQKSQQVATTMIVRERREGAASSLWTSLKNQSEAQNAGFAFDLGDDLDESNQDGDLDGET